MEILSYHADGVYGILETRLNLEQEIKRCNVIKIVNWHQEHWTPVCLGIILQRFSEQWSQFLMHLMKVAFQILALFLILGLSLQTDVNSPFSWRQKQTKSQKFGQEVSFTCCTESENVPSIWWYNVTTFATAIIDNEPFFTVDIDILKQGSGVGMNSNIFFICGEHDRHGIQVSSRIGKLVLNLENQEGVITLLGKIESGRSSPGVVPYDEENCTWSHIITISVQPPENEHSTLGSTSTLAVSISKLAVSTSTLAVSTSTLAVSTSNFNVLYRLEIVISVIALCAISILLNIAFCVSRCSKTCKSDNGSATEGNEIGDNHQTNPTSDRYEGGGRGAFERTALSSEYLTPIVRQNCGVSGINKEGDEKLNSKTTLTLGTEKYSYENNSVLYRKVNDNCEASTSTDMLEDCSSVEDAKSTGCDLASSSCTDHPTGLPWNVTTRLAREVYVNTPTRQKKGVHLYEMPDDTWNSGNSVNLDPHARSLSTLADPCYDILNRPEIEDLG